MISCLSNHLGDDFDKLAILAIFWLTLLAFCLGWLFASHRWRRQAIKLGVVVYHAQTGKPVFDCDGSPAP